MFGNMHAVEAVWFTSYLVYAAALQRAEERNKLLKLCVFNTRLLT